VALMAFDTSAFLAILLRQPDLERFKDDDFSRTDIRPALT
jgi:uncharacterized protein with PIN domain